MTEQQQQEARERALQFGVLAAVLLLGAGSSAALLYFLSKLAKGEPLEGSFDRVKEQTREVLQSDFDRIVTELAPRAATDLQAWSGAMAASITGYLIAQVIAARGRPLLPTESLVLERGPILDQMDYLDGFTRHLRDHDVTEAYIISRAKLYGGAGRALWYRTAEEAAPIGWVVDYVSVDDSGTCLPCVVSEIQGPYLFGHGPFPGEVCLGRGRCRCRREPRFDRTAWELLDAERLAEAA